MHLRRPPSGGRRIASKMDVDVDSDRLEVISGMNVLKIKALIQRLTDRDDDTGQGLAEYALILALIAIVAIVALLFMGSQISDKLSVIGGTIDSVTP
jgi:pilus assembly protein Flp/PilA